MAFPVIDGLRTIEFGTPGQIRDWLVSLVLDGVKCASAGLLSEYADEGEPLEQVGELLAVVDGEGRRVATLRVLRVDVMRFADVPDDFALAEGEGDLSGDDFRAGHSSYWGRQGISVDGDTEVVLIRFERLS